MFYCILEEVELYYRLLRFLPGEIIVLVAAQLELKASLGLRLNIGRRSDHYSKSRAFIYF